MSPTASRPISWAKADAGGANAKKSVPFPVAGLPVRVAPAVGLGLAEGLGGVQGLSGVSALDFLPPACPPTGSASDFVLASPTPPQGLSADWAGGLGRPARQGGVMSEGDVSQEMWAGIREVNPPCPI